MEDLANGLLRTLRRNLRQLRNAERCAVSFVAGGCLAAAGASRARRKVTVRAAWPSSQRGHQIHHRTILERNGIFRRFPRRPEIRKENQSRMRELSL